MNINQLQASVNALQQRGYVIPEKRWIVLYGDGRCEDKSFWGSFQTRDEAVWQAFRRSKNGWATRIIEPQP